MSDLRDDDELPKPPPSGGLKWYRLLLWVMPTCVAVTTLVGCVVVRAWFSLFFGMAVLLWLGVSIIATIALGIFHARLEVSREEGVRPGIDPMDVVQFVAAQIFLVPLLSYAVYAVFAVLVVSGVF